VGEYVKITRQYFFYIAILIIVLVCILAAEFVPKLYGRTAKIETLHSIEIFSYSYPTGLKIAILFAVVFSSLAFSSEFERGTIRILLSKPITRTDFFIAKVLIITCLTLFFMMVAFYTSFLYGLIKGEMGVVWKAGEFYYIKSWGLEKILKDMSKAILLSILPALATAYLALLISAWLDHGGFAVAISIILVFSFDVILKFVREPEYLFFYYINYAFDVLSGFAKGLDDVRWEQKYDKTLCYVTYPAFYSLLFFILAFLRIRFRNVIS
jgi:ABC-type transport system involved in multi-copper enzyme maturation permease subunit